MNEWKDDTKRIEIVKSHDGTIEVLNGCSIDEFNKGGGLIITNNGKLPDNAISISVRIENGLTDSNQSYRVRFDVSPDDDLDEKMRTLSYSIQKICSFLLGKDGFVYGDSSTYSDYEEDYIKNNSIKGD